MYIRIDRRSEFWFGIFVIGGVMASGTLFVLDASLPGGFVVGSGSMRYVQIMAFTTLMVFQLFNVLNARAGERSAFKGLFTNRWVWAIGLSVALQVAVIYTPFLQRAFSTASLNFADWLRCTMVASSVLWLRELSKAVTRAVNSPA
jgi:Ca2+-transporting ATPase